MRHEGTDEEEGGIIAQPSNDVNQEKPPYFLQTSEQNSLMSDSVALSLNFEMPRLQEEFHAANGPPLTGV